MPAIVKFIFALLVLLASANAEALANEDCLACHDIDKARFEKSIHGRNPCTACHTDALPAPHEKKPSPVKCEDCHTAEQQAYQASFHGRATAEGITEAASCKACHGEAHYLLDYRREASPVSRNRVNETCARCHDDLKKMEQYHLTQREPYKSYMGSVHGKAFKAGDISAAVCTDCHGSHDLYSPNNPESSIYKFNVPTTCSKCHEKAYKAYNISIHAKTLYAGVRDSPVCTDCHGEHTIQRPTEPSSAVYPSSIVKTCSHCHASEKITTKYQLPKEVLSTYLESYHGVAFQYGSLTAANCASCHGYHDILPSSDPRSGVNPANIGRTCGNCHPGAGEALAKGSVHLRPSVDRDKIIYYVSLFYISLIIMVIGGMIAHNALDIGKKMKAHYRRSVTESVAVRMTQSERIQHIVLLICFAVLVYTGFAHKYPKAFFSYPFNLVEWGPELRKVVHRTAGVIFIILIGYHCLWLFAVKRGREKLVALLPRMQDIRDAVNLVGYNLGIVRQRPKFDRYSYIEKAEYWALIWGSFIMIITGLVLMFENISLHFMPKWLIDVMLLVHFFEAVLASLAILVWHFYWAIFDPEVYPMNWTWITGKVTEHQMKERKPPPLSTL